MNTRTRTHNRLSVFPVLSLVLGVVTASFAIYYGFEVYHQHIYFSGHKYIGVVSSVVFIAAAAGLTMGILSFKSAGKLMSEGGAILCGSALCALIVIDLSFFPGSGTAGNLPNYYYPPN